MVISKAQLEDLPKILKLQKKCYLTEAVIYNRFDIPPLIQTLQSINEDYDQYTFLKIESNGQIIGSVKGTMKDTTCLVERLIVDENFQNRGLGKQLLTAIENHFKHASEYQLFTGHKSLKNISFYKKTGYQQYKTETVNDQLKLVFLSKNNEVI